MTLPLFLGHLSGGVPPGNAAEGQAFANIPSALVQIAVDRAQFSSAIQPGDRGTVRAHDLSLFIASRATLGVEHRGRQLDRVKRFVDDRRQHQGSAKIRVVLRLAVAVPSADGVRHVGRVEAEDRGEIRNAVGGLDPAFSQLGAIVLAPIVALDDLRPTMARVLVVERAGLEQSVVENQKHRARGG